MDVDSTSLRSMVYCGFGFVRATNSFFVTQKSCIVLPDMRKRENSTKTKDARRNQNNMIVRIVPYVE